jgi:hypothetical protein
LSLRQFLDPSESRALLIVRGTFVECILNVESETTAPPRADKRPVVWNLLRRGRRVLFADGRGALSRGIEGIDGSLE